jgi:murein DD-endopeptidase MepM/ murein hydrolase activator NlpD
MSAKNMLEWWKDFLKGNLLKLQSMAFPHTPQLDFPLDGYKVSGDEFLKDCTFNGVHWGLHLGEDFNVRAGAKVKSIGRGKVVYSAPHLGKIVKEEDGKEKLQRNWGNIIIIAHKNPRTKKVFCSVYGHLNKRFKKKGDRVEIGEVIGTIAEADTPENGLWEDSHLHFAIYTGPYPWVRIDKKRRLLPVLPGYLKEERPLTKCQWWQNPTKFISDY